MKRNSLKKMGSLLLAAALALTCFPAAFTLTASASAPEAHPGFTDAELTVPVYVGCSYTVTLSGAAYTNGLSDDGVKLTDRIMLHSKKNSDGLNTKGWIFVKGASDYTVTVTLDLGRTYSNLNNFFFRTGKAEEPGAAPPTSSEVSVSTDGKNYKKIGNCTTVSDMNVPHGLAIYRFRPKSGIEARYVRFTLRCTGGKTFMTNEIGVCAKGSAFRPNGDTSGVFYDMQGVGYELNPDGTATVADTLGYGLKISGQCVPTDVSFDEDDITFYIGKGTGNEVKVISDFINDPALNRSGVPNHIQYIVIHNTGTVEEVTDSNRYNYRMHTMDDESSWHFTVDDKQVYHSLENSAVGWHAGADLNFRSIGIEMCVNGAPSNGGTRFIFSGSTYDRWVNERFRKTIKNTAVLVAELLVRYGLTPDRVIQHYDCDNKNCPMWLRSNGKGGFTYNGVLWVEFMGYVNDYYAMLSGSPIPASEQTSVELPEYVIDQSSRCYPVASIAATAFDGAADQLRSIVIPKTVSSIADGAFDCCSELETITVDKDNNYYSADGGVLYDSKGDVVYEPDLSGAVAPEPKEGSPVKVFTIGQRYYTLLTAADHTVAKLCSDYGADGEAANAKGRALAGGDPLGTGSYVKFGDAKLYIVVRGDGDGDGDTTAADYLMAKRIVLGTYDAAAPKIKALALTGGERIRAVDYAMLKRHVLANYDFYIG